MRKYAILSVVFGSILLLFGCEKEQDIKNIPKENPKFTLSISPEADTVEVGEKVPVTIRTEGGDSVTFRSNDTDTVHSYSRPVGLTGFWEIIDTLYVNSEGSNVAHIAAFQFIEGLDDPIVKNGQSSIVGCYPYLQVSADPSQIPWRTSALITIKTFGCDSLWTDLPGVNGQLNGTFPTPVLDTTTTYHFKLFNKQSGDVIEASEIIYVKDPTREDTLSYKLGPWRMIKLEFQSYPGGPWNEATIWDCALDDLVYYYLYPEKTGLYDMGEIPCFDGDSDRTGLWHLESNGTVLVTYQYVNQSGYNYYDIEVLDENTLVLIYHHDNGTSTKTIYGHP